MPFQKGHKPFNQKPNDDAGVALPTEMLPVETQAKSQVDTIYWAPASDYQIANWIPEKRDGAGRVEQPEVPLRFSENIFVAHTDKERQFIEATTAFEIGQIVKCKDMAQARELSHVRRMKKTVTDYKTEVSVSRTFENANIPRMSDAGIVSTDFGDVK
jgi:hypothetical protein